MPDAYASQERKRCQKMSETFVAKLVYTVVCLVLSDVSPLSGRRVVVNASIFSLVLWPRHDDASEKTIFFLEFYRHACYSAVYFSVWVCCLRLVMAYT